jgi:uncharacterized protein involved in exopolysaccharide biosynthesis
VSEVDRIDRVTTQDINTEIEILNSDNVIRDTVASLMEQGQSLKYQQKNVAWYRVPFNYLKAGINKVWIFLGFKKPLSKFDSNVSLLRQSLRIEPVAVSNIITVKLRSENPEKAAFMLNTLIEIYIKHHNQVFSKDEGINFFNDQADEYRKKLEYAEKKLTDFQGQWHIVDIETQHRVHIDQLSQLNSELKHIEISIDEIESKISILKNGLKNGIEITKEMRIIPAIVALETALVPLYIERGETLRTYTKSSREYIHIEAQIKIILDQIRNEVKKAIKTENLELNSLRAKGKSLSRKIALTQRETDILVQKERELNDIKRQVSLLQENYMLYASKTEDARIYSERKKRNLANVNIAERAEIPVKPSYPQTRLMLIISIIVGFFAAIGTPFILEFLDHRIKTSEEVEKLLSLPVICTLPEVKRS